ncbi:MAG TPA: hypothetical protein VGN05_10780 [Parvibaculum sp.]|jgi:hypothetical protein
MEYKPPSIEHVSIGDIRAMSTEGFSFVTVYLSFETDDTGAHPSIEIEVPVKWDISWSVEKIYEVALEKAKGVMHASIGLISPLNVQQLEQLKVDLLAIEEKKTSESMENLAKPLL